MFFRFTGVRTVHRHKRRRLKEVLYQMLKTMCILYGIPYNISMIKDIHLLHI